MKLLITGRLLLNNVVKRQGSFLQTYRNSCGWNYVNNRRFQVDEVNVIENEDPCGVKIIEKQGEYWHVTNESHTTSVAQTVSGDFNLANGLHRAFYLQFFDKIDFEYLRERQPYRLGDCAVFHNGKNFVYFLIIRENWFYRGAYRPLRESLEAMRNHAVENNVKNITMGRLASGEDGLDFKWCLEDAKKIFYDSGVTLTFYVRTTGTQISPGGLMDTSYKQFNSYREFKKQGIRDPIKGWMKRREIEMYTRTMDD